MILELFRAIGAAMQRNRESMSNYSPRYGGMWVKRKKYGVDEIVWKDLTPKERPQYVSVFNIEDDYVITVGYNPRRQSIETIECDDSRSVELAVKLAKAEYSCHGNVIISLEE